MHGITFKTGQAKWSTALISTLERQRQEDLCDFKANLVYQPRFKKPCLKSKERHQAVDGEVGKSLQTSASQRTSINNDVCHPRQGKLGQKGFAGTVKKGVSGKVLYK